MDKPRKYHSLDQLGGSIPLDGGGSDKYDKKIEKIRAKEEKLLENKDEILEEADADSQDYNEYIKPRLRNHWASLRKTSGKLIDDIFENAGERSKKRPIWTLDFIKEDAKKRAEAKEHKDKAKIIPLGNQGSILTSITKEPKPTLTYTSELINTSQDNGIINLSPMPEKRSQKSAIKSAEKNAPSAEDLKLQAVLDHEIAYWKGKLPGSKPRYLMAFKTRPFEFINESLENRKTKLIAEKTRLELMANRKTSDSKTISEIDSELDALNYNLGYIKQAIERKIPHPTDEFFTVDKEKTPEIEFEKIKEGSIISIRDGKRYRITSIEGDEVTYYDLYNKNSPQKIKLEYLQKMMLQPRAKIFTTGTPKKQIDSMIPPDIKVSGYTIKDVDKMKKDWGIQGVGLSSPLLIKRYLKGVSMEEAQTLYDEYNKLHGRDNTAEPADTNLEPVNSPEPLQGIEHSEKFLNLMKEIKELENRKKELEDNIEKATKESFIPKPEDSSKLIGWAPSKFTTKVEDIKIRQGSKPKTDNGVFEMGYSEPTPKPEDTSRYIEYKPLEQKQDVNRIDDIPFEEVKNGDIKVRPPHVEVIRANSTGVIDLIKEKEDIVPKPPQEHIDISHKDENHLVKTIKTVEELYAQGKLTNNPNQTKTSSIEVQNPEELVTNNTGFTIDAIKPSITAKEKFGMAKIKEAVMESIEESRLKIKDPRVRVSEHSSFIVDGKINGWDVSITFKDEGEGLNPTNIKLDEYKKPFFASTKGTIRKAEKRAYALISSLKSHLGKKLGKIDSIGMRNGELVFNQNN